MPDAGPATQDTSEPFSARTPWSAGAATAFGIITVVMSLLVAGIVQPIHSPIGDWLGRIYAPDPEAEPAITLAANVMLTLIVMQVVMSSMAWWGAGRFGGSRRAVLSLDRGFSARAFLYGLLGMAALLIPYNLLIYFFFPSHFAADLRPMWDLARSPVSWLVGLAVAIGAPISEELLFRGFLLPALAKTRHGFTGAAIGSTIGWTALHFYSLAGLVEVFLVGILFCWLVQRFRSLWLPMTLHVLYNGLQLLVIASWPT